MWRDLFFCTNFLFYSHFIEILSLFLFYCLLSTTILTMPIFDKRLFNQMLIHSFLLINLFFHSLFRKRACVITIILRHFFEELSLVCLTRLIKRFVIICFGETWKSREASWALLNKLVSPFSITTHRVDAIMENQ